MCVVCVKKHKMKCFKPLEKVIGRIKKKKEGEIVQEAKQKKEYIS